MWGVKCAKVKLGYVKCAKSMSVQGHTQETTVQVEGPMPLRWHEA